MRRAGDGAGARGGDGRARLILRARLESRRGEIEAAAFARIAAIADPGEVSDPAYAEGLRRSVPAAIEFGLEAIEAGVGREPPIPVELLAQARLAARNGIALDIVLRRYFAGYSLLGYFLVEEAGRDSQADDSVPGRLIAAQATHLDRLLAAVGEEHRREAAERPPGAEQRRAELVRALLGGEPLDASPLGYELDAHHLAIVGSGAGAGEAIRGLVAPLDRRLLLVDPAEETFWAWLGGRLALERSQVDELTSSLGEGAPAGAAFALGEPADGPEGWRLSHRQAAAALPVAERGSKPVARYRDVALLAAALQDDLLATSLRRLYLEPLGSDRVGNALRETLRAYFEAGRNSASAAAALGITRQTVNNRLRSIERRLEISLAALTGELELALRLSLFQRSN